jgi:hypothetical protein
MRRERETLLLSWQREIKERAVYCLLIGIIPRKGATDRRRRTSDLSNAGGRGKRRERNPHFE